jgi:hypothetical protein
VLLSVALFAALIGHVTIDVLGDYLLAHDDYDDVDHSSRVIVAIVTFVLAGCGAGFGLRAAIREARGSENALCLALRSALPRNSLIFTLAAIALSTIILCVMEACDASLAGHPVDDVGDLFAGSIPFGGTIIAVVAMLVSQITLGGLRRLARVRSLASVVVAFLRRCFPVFRTTEIDLDVIDRLVFHAHHICRRIAGRAPPPLIVAVTS